jgi:hypothetical protein
MFLPSKPDQDKAGAADKCIDNSNIQLPEVDAD